MSWVTALLGLAPLGAIATSCADAEDTPARNDVNDGGPQADADDAECDAGGGGCAPAPEISCDDVEWCPVDTSLLRGRRLAGIWGSGPSDVWTVGTGGTAIHWDGTAWASVPVTTAYSLRAVWGSGPSDVWAVSTPNKIFHTTGFADGKATWSPVAAIAEDQNFGQLLLAIWGTSSSEVWVGGNFQIPGPEFDQIESGWRSVVVDGAPSWTSMSSLPGIEIRSIWGSGPEDVWLAGSRGNVSFVAHTHGVAAADGGVPVWKELETHTIAPLYAVWGSGPGDVWAVGDYGTILHFVPAEDEWRAVDSPTGAKLRALWGTGPNDVWAVGEHGTILHYDGTAFRPSSGVFAPGKGPDLYGVWGSGPSDVWAVGSGIIVHYSGPKPGAGETSP